MNKTHQFVDVDGLKIHYILAGQGDRAVILVHGGGLDTAELSWGQLIPALADQFRVISLDLPGFGESDKRTCNTGSLSSLMYLRNSWMQYILLKRAW